jgi:hypothetical protein
MPLVSKDYDIRSFSNSGDLHAQPKAELIDALAGYEGPPCSCPRPASLRLRP